MFKRTLFCFSAVLGLAGLQACAAAAPPSGGDEAGGAATTTTGGQVSTSGGAAPAGAGAPGASGGSLNPGAGGSPTAGSTAGSGGVPSSGGASGGSAPVMPMTQFGQVTALLSKRCAGSKCHGNGSSQLAIASATGGTLHTLLTTPIGSAVPHCVGLTLVTPNDVNSPLLKVVASGGKIACTKPKSESIGPMPEKCSATSTSQTGVCLNATEIKTLSDWIAAGAPQN